MRQSRFRLIPFRSLLKCLRLLVLSLLIGIFLSLFLACYESKVEVLKEVRISISKGRPASIELVKQEEKLRYTSNEIHTSTTATRLEARLRTSPGTITRHEKKLRTTSTFNKSKLQGKVVETGTANKIMPTINPLIPEFKSWKDSMEVFCNGSFFAFAGEFAFAREIILDPSHAIGLLGGEDLNEVLNQKEYLEFYKFKKGFFVLPCQPTYSFGSNNYLNTWLAMIHNNYYQMKLSISKVNKQFTLALTRFEYANLYHTVTDYYNAFLAMMFFKKTPEETAILLVDGHPKGSLDNTWSILFNKVTRIGSVKGVTLHNEFVWVEQGYNSPMSNQEANSIPIVKKFREFFLHKHGVDSESHKLNCSAVNLLFLWRRNYVAHPRNPSGQVSRKIKNEEQLVKYVTENYMNVNVKAYQLDQFNMSMQLAIIAKTDILVGMHGVGLTHSMFLPKHAGLIEFYPIYWSSNNLVFKAIARFRNLHYENWVNKEPKYEFPNEYTQVPMYIIADKLNRILEKMKCI